MFVFVYTGKYCQFSDHFSVSIPDQGHQRGLDVQDHGQDRDPGQDHDPSGRRGPAQESAHHDAASDQDHETAGTEGGSERREKRRIGRRKKESWREKNKGCPQSRTNI